MDPTKKRRLDENGVALATDFTNSPAKLSPDDARKMMERFTADQLLDILQTAVIRHPDVLSAVRSVADSDITQRKLFIRGLGWETTSENLRNIFAVYGELDEAVVILDKSTGKSKGYGFVIYKHVDGAILALKEPSKRIDGRVTVTQLAAAGNSGGNSGVSGGGSSGSDVAMRKIYVANVPYDMQADKLLSHFSVYGEIEEGPLGFDKQTGKSRGFALFVYKNPEGAQTALVEPVKIIDGRQLNCKLAIEGKKGKVGQEGAQGHVQGGSGHGDGMGMGGQGGYGGTGGHGGFGGYGGYSGGFQGPPAMGGHQVPMNSIGGPGMGSQVPSGAMSGGGGYGSLTTGAGAGFGGSYAGYGGPGSTGYNGYGGGGGAGAMGSGGSGMSSVANTGAAGGASGASSLYRMQPNSAGVPSSGYPEAGHYGMSSAAASFMGQHQGASPVPRMQPGGAYPSMPPYY